MCQKIAIHVIGDASSCGMPKAGHVADQEAKICADAIVRLAPIHGRPSAKTAVSASNRP